MFVDGAQAHWGRVPPIPGVERIELTFSKLTFAACGNIDPGSSSAI